MSYDSVRGAWGQIRTAEEPTIILVAHGAPKRASEIQEPEPDGMPQVVIEEAGGLPQVSL